MGHLVWSMGREKGADTIASHESLEVLERNKYHTNSYAMTKIEEVIGVSGIDTRR